MLLWGGAGWRKRRRGANTIKPRLISGQRSERVCALGDSITGDINYGVAPYPPRLAGMLGQTVINEGNGGETAAAAAPEG